MKFASLLWNRLPVVLRAIVNGLLVLFFGALAWTAMLVINLKLTSSVPWAAGTLVLFLWIYWHYLNGAGWPRSTAQARHTNFRAHQLSGRTWFWALMTGATALAGAVALQGVFERLVRIPPLPFTNLSQYPSTTVLVVLLAAAAEAGIVEEAAFRGYMQAPIERRYGPGIAVAVVAVVFGCSHLANGFHELLWLPVYFLVGVILGVVAYLTNSILPGMVLHASLDAFRFLTAWRRGAVRQERLIWVSGADASFWTSLAAAVIFGVVAVWAYKKLAVVARSGVRPSRAMSGQEGPLSAGRM